MRDVESSPHGGCGCEPEFHGLDAGPEPMATAPASSRRRFLRTAALAALGGPALFAAACSSGGTSNGVAHLPNPTTPGVSGTSGGAGTSGTPGVPGGPGASTPGTSTATPAGAKSDHPAGGGPDTANAALLASKYGLKPFAPAPAPPSVKPVNTNVPLPPVVDHIPNLTDKIVFLTIDDGAEKEPAFIDMVKDFKVPITLFLTDSMIKADYSYFQKLLDTGYVTIQNHTLTHPDLKSVSAERQKAEISGQQTKLAREYGTTPYLFRAPYGNSNTVTQEVCKANGLKAIMYWRASFQKQGFQWQDPYKQLHPGDILLSHFRGPVSLGAGWPKMHELMVNLFRIVQEQGFTFARLEDYV